MTCRRSSQFRWSRDTRRTWTGSRGRSLLEQRVQRRQRLRPRLLLLRRPLPLLEHEQLAGVRPFLVAGRLRLRLPAPVPHRLVISVAVEAAVERGAAVRAFVAAARAARHAQVHLPAASVADVHGAHLARSAPEALRSVASPPCASPSSSGTTSSSSGLPWAEWRRCSSPRPSGWKGSRGSW